MDKKKEKLKKLLKEKKQLQADIEENEYLADTHEMKLYVKKEEN